MPPLYLFTDFGYAGPYVGLMKAAACHAGLGEGRVVDLMHDAPRFRPGEAGLLLARLLAWLPADAGIAAVVDPGVGTERGALLVRIGNRILTGPDNGLLVPAMKEAAERGLAVSVAEILWRPERLSASFHGRDLFVPAAVRALTGRPLKARPLAFADLVGWENPPDPARIVYIDGFGNAMTGLVAAALGDARLEAAGQTLARAQTFADVPAGEPFWYENSLGLAEIAVNQGSAAVLLGLAIGTPVTIQ